MHEPTYVATAKAGDVVIIGLPASTSTDMLRIMADELQKYFEPRDIGCVVILGAEVINASQGDNHHDDR